jgi:hypothetical protein
MKRKGLELLGFCGVYCGACTTYRAYNDNDQALVEWEIRTGMPKEEIVCKGCRSGLVNKWCSECKFRKCIENKKIENCFQCETFPCKMLVDFSETRPHRTLGLRNLVQLRDASLEDWLKEQEKRWTCPSCGKKLHWYAEKCPKCRAKFLTATKEASLH